MGYAGFPVDCFLPRFYGQGRPNCRFIPAYGLRFTALAQRAQSKKTKTGTAATMPPSRISTLVVASAQDHMVNPTPALELARTLHAEVVELSGDCGHLEPGCDKVEAAPKVREFLAN